MSLPTGLLDNTGNFEIEDGIRISFDTMLNKAIPGNTQPSVVAGTGAPTFSAPQGTLYLNITGSSVSTRAYINTTGSTTWTAVTTAA